MSSPDPKVSEAEEEPGDGGAAEIHAGQNDGASSSNGSPAGAAAQSPARAAVSSSPSRKKTREEDAGGDATATGEVQEDEGSRQEGGIDNDKDKGGGAAGDGDIANGDGGGENGNASSDGGAGGVQVLVRKKGRPPKILSNGKRGRPPKYRPGLVLVPSQIRPPPPPRPDAPPTRHRPPAPPPCRFSNRQALKLEAPSLDDDIYVYPSASANVYSSITTAASKDETRKNKSGAAMQDLLAVALQEQPIGQEGGGGGAGGPPLAGPSAKRKKKKPATTTTSSTAAASSVSGAAAAAAGGGGRGGASISASNKAKPSSASECRPTALPIAKTKTVPAKGGTAAKGSDGQVKMEPPPPSKGPRKSGRSTKAPSAENTAASASTAAAAVATTTSAAKTATKFKAATKAKRTFVNPPKAIVGAKIAEIFPGWGLYMGEIIEIQRHPDGSNSWRIRYEDGEEQEMDGEEVGEALKLLEKAEKEVEEQIDLSKAWQQERQERGGVAQEVVEVGEVEDEDEQEEDQEEEKEEEEEEQQTKAKKAVVPKKKKRRIIEVSEDEEEESEEEKENGKEEKEEEEESPSEASTTDSDDDFSLDGGNNTRKKRARPKSSASSLIAAPVCDKCYCDFTSKGGLKYHVEQKVCEDHKKRETKELPEGESMACPTCHRSFTSANCLRYHIERASTCYRKSDDPDVQRLLHSLLTRAPRPPQPQQPKAVFKAKPKPPKARPVVSGFSSSFASKANKKGSSTNTVVVSRQGGYEDGEEGEEEESEKMSQSVRDESDVEYVDETGDFMDESDEEGGGSRRRGGGGGESSSWRGGSTSRAHVFAKPKKPSRICTKAIQVFLPGIEGPVQADGSPHLVPAKDPSIITDLRKVKHLIDEKALILAKTTTMDGGIGAIKECNLMEWLTQNGLSVASIPIHLVTTTGGGGGGGQQRGPGASIFRDVDLVPFQGVFNPLSPTPQSSSLLNKTKLDFLLNACGPVYGLDLLIPPPQAAAAAGQGGRGGASAAAASITKVYAAIGTSSIAPKCATASDVSIMTGQPGVPKLHAKGKATSDPNLLQLWTLSPPSQDSASPSSSSAAAAAVAGNVRMTYAIGHHFGSVWDLRWASPKLMEGTATASGAIGALVGVFSDGKARLFIMPSRPSPPPSSATATTPPLLLLPPLIVMTTKPEVCLTTARFSPHDPGLVLCGASNGMIFWYKIDSSHMIQIASAEREGEGGGEGGSSTREAPIKLMPVRRFVDSRDSVAACSGSVLCAEWHPSHAGLFFACGYDVPLRLWDTKKPFRPVAEKNSFRLCKSAVWLPNGFGCLGGFVNGAVRAFGLPEDILKVRVYRHESASFDGVTNIAAAHVPKMGTYISSTGGDGQQFLIHLDENDLAPRRAGYYQGNSEYLIPLCLTASKDGAGAQVNPRLTCDVGIKRPEFKNEQTDPAATGILLQPLRASLTKTQICPVPDVEGSAVIGIGGFAGLVRVVDLSVFFKPSAT